MQFLYSISIWAYTIALNIASLWNSKAKQMIIGRAESKASFASQLDQKKPKIWLHCASVGEFEQGLPVLNELRNKWPHAQFIITFFSPSGYNYAKAKYPAETISYLPFDFSSNMSSLVDLINPQFVVFIKYEFWFNLLSVLKQKNIASYLVSGVFRKEQLFFKKYGAFFRDKLNCFQHFFVQDKESISLLKSIGFYNSSLSGDTRFDRVVQLSNQSFHDEKIEQFIGKQKVLIAGSIWQEDMNMINEFITLLPTDWKIILVPHELNHFKQAWIHEKPCIYTKEIDNSSRVLLLDKMGLLAKLYRFATVAYVGGGFGKSIHNTLEAAVYRIPVLFGPTWKKFHEAHLLINSECAFDVSDSNFMPEIWNKVVSNTEFRSKISDQLNIIFNENANVAQKICVLIEQEQGPKMKTFFNN